MTIKQIETIETIVREIEKVGAIIIILLLLALAFTSCEKVGYDETPKDFKQKYSTDTIIGADTLIIAPFDTVVLIRW